MADEEKCYKFEELSPEAKKRAIEQWRDKRYDFDDHDAKDLTEWFQEELVDEGFNDGVKAFWSLNYCQGDGVCFEGTLDLDKFFDKEGWRAYKELSDYLVVKVTNSDHHYCHWNSMAVEIDYREPDDEQLIPEAIFHEMVDWDVERKKLEREYNEELEKIREARQAPIREWQEQIRRFEERKGVLEWLPDKPEKPAPLDIPAPPDPDYPDEPKKFIRAKEKAAEKRKRLDAKVATLQEEVEEWVEDVSRRLEKAGYDEIEYKGSDEVIEDAITANDYEFTEDGDMC